MNKYSLGLANQALATAILKREKEKGVLSLQDVKEMKRQKEESIFEAEPQKEEIAGEDSFVKKTKEG